MRNWQITLEYNEGTRTRKAHWYWEVFGERADHPRGLMPTLGAGRAESLSEATDEIGSVVDVDLNNDWV